MTCKLQCPECWQKKRVHPVVPRPQWKWPGKRNAGKDFITTFSLITWSSAMQSWHVRASIILRLVSCFFRSSCFDFHFFSVQFHDWIKGSRVYAARLRVVPPLIWELDLHLDYLGGSSFVRQAQSTVYRNLMRWISLYSEERKADSFESNMFLEAWLKAFFSRFFALQISLLKTVWRLIIAFVLYTYTKQHTDSRGSLATMALFTKYAHRVVETPTFGILIKTCKKL